MLRMVILGKQLFTEIGSISGIIAAAYIALKKLIKVEPIGFRVTDPDCEKRLSILQIKFDDQDIKMDDLKDTLIKVQADHYLETEHLRKQIESLRKGYT